MTSGSGKDPNSYSRASPLNRGMSSKPVIEEILEGGDELSKLKADVLRALAVFNGVSWMSELLPDILKIRGYSIDYMPSEKLLEEALGQLEAAKLVSVEARRRGDFPSKRIYVDKLVRLRDPETVRRMLASDEIYKSYLSRQLEILRRSAARRD